MNHVDLTALLEELQELAGVSNDPVLGPELRAMTREIVRRGIELVLDRDVDAEEAIARLELLAAEWDARARALLEELLAPGLTDPSSRMAARRREVRRRRQLRIRRRFEGGAHG